MATWASLGVGSGAFVLGGTAVGWQLHTWRWAGPRLSVSACRSHSDDRLGARPGGPEPQEAQETIVSVTNRGPLAAHLEGYGFRLTGVAGARYEVDIHERDDAKRRVTVSPHDSFRFTVLDLVLLPDLMGRGLDRGRAFVRLTTGKKVFDRKEVRFFAWRSSA